MAYTAATMCFLIYFRIPTYIEQDRLGWIANSWFWRSSESSLGSSSRKIWFRQRVETRVWMKALIRNAWMGLRPWLLVVFLFDPWGEGSSFLLKRASWRWEHILRPHEWKAGKRNYGLLFAIIFWFSWYRPQAAEHELPRKWSVLVPHP